MKPQLSWVLSGIAVGMIVATALCVVKYGPVVYYLTFHRPFQLTAASSMQQPNAAVLPGFDVQASIAKMVTLVGDDQTITVIVTPKQTTKGFLEVWITSPGHRQVFQSTIDEKLPMQFTAGRSQTSRFTFPLTASLPKGTYAVSELITSPNRQSDYQLNEAFASFTLE